LGTVAGMGKALLFDVGDVLMEHNWRLMELLGAKQGRDLGFRGPFEPASDPEFQRVEAGEIHLDEYWDIAARASGYADRIELWRAMSFEIADDVFAADAFALVDEAIAAGIPVGILTNDLVRSSGRPWVDSRPEFEKFPVLVDCTEFGERKPAPAPYLKAASEFGLPCEHIVFLDDMQYCIDGAHNVGMIGVLVDPLHREAAFNEARRLVGLPPAGSKGIA
jgi:putative hydrolase of the HAD superfamily